MAPGRASRRLGELARQLNAARGPFYVRRPIPIGLRKTFPAEGWYWVPAGHQFAIFLASDEIAAATILIRQIEEQEDV